MYLQGKYQTEPRPEERLCTRNIGRLIDGVICCIALDD